MPVITVENMRQSDAHTIEKYVAGRKLMYRAAMGVYRAADWRGRIGILTGSGNNGGDGYALACILADHGIPCRIIRVSEKFSEDGNDYFQKAEARGVKAGLFSPQEDLRSFDILVDCMLGTGFSGEVRGPIAAAIEAVNTSGAYVISVDINSGMNGDTGKADLAIKSNLTVAIGYLKAGMFLGDSFQYMKKLSVADIGIRLLRENFFLAAPSEIVFPQSGLRFREETTLLLTPGEAEAVEQDGQSIPEVARSLALEKGRIVRVLGRNSLITDGHKTYFLESGDFPQVIFSMGDEE